MVHDAMQKLHQLAHSAIFGQTAWPANREKRESIWQMLADAGLIKETANGTFSYTDPSVTAELDLLLAFIGATEPWDIPFDLTEHGYASEEEAMQVWEAETEAEGMRLLKLFIFRAYQMHADKPKLAAPAHLEHLNIILIVQSSSSFAVVPRRLVAGSSMALALRERPLCPRERAKRCFAAK